MILTAFKLERDRHTATESFGYERQLWPGHVGVSHYPKLGCPIADVGVPLRTNVVKIVELYDREEMVVVERLAWRVGRLLYPYRAKYIRPVTQDYQDDPILFLANMSAIHRQLSRIDVRFVSPLAYCLESVVDAVAGAPAARYMLDVQARHRDALETFAPQETDIINLRDFMLAAENDCFYKVGRSGQVLPSEDLIMARPPVAEPMAARFAARPLSASAIAPGGVGNNPFDTSEVPAIEIRHPVVTRYSPEDHHPVARMCDQLSYQYSDVEIEYILSGREVRGHQVNHLVSRYHDATNDAVSYCQMIIETAADIAFKRCVGRVVHARFQLTYGDEVLIEFYTPDRAHCLVAVHLDLAMIALCASGVIATPA